MKSDWQGWKNVLVCSYRLDVVRGDVFHVERKKIGGDV